MNSETHQNPILVYLDNTQIVWARNGHLPGWNRTVAAQMAEEHGFTWALSSAHLDDCSHRDDHGRLQQAADLPSGVGTHRMTASVSGILAKSVVAVSRPAFQASATLSLKMCLM